MSTHLYSRGLGKKYQDTLPTTGRSYKKQSSIGLYSVVVITAYPFIATADVMNVLCVLFPFLIHLQLRISRRNKLIVLPLLKPDSCVSPRTFA